MKDEKRSWKRNEVDVQNRKKEPNNSAAAGGSAVPDQILGLDSELLTIFPCGKSERRNRDASLSVTPVLLNSRLIRAEHCLIRVSMVTDALAVRHGGLNGYQGQ